MGGFLGGFFGGGSDVQTPALDPAAQNALNQVVAQALGLAGQNLPFVAPFDAATIQGLQFLQDRPESSFVQPAAQNLTSLLSQNTGAGLDAGLGQIGSTLAGNFFGGDPGAAGFNPGLDAVRASITGQAQQAVGDQFSAAGRTGSPAQAITLGRTVANALAPFEFQAFGDNLNRQSAAFQNERQRQLAAANLGIDSSLGLGALQNDGLRLAPGIESLLNSQAQRLLGVGNVIQAQNQRVLTEPQTAFSFFTDPLISAAGGFPIGQTLQNRASGSQIVGNIPGFLGDLGGIGNILFG